MCNQRFYLTDMNHTAWNRLYLRSALFMVELLSVEGKNPDFDIPIFEQSLSIDSPFNFAQFCDIFGILVGYMSFQTKISYPYSRIWRRLHHLLAIRPMSVDLVQCFIQNHQNCRRLLPPYLITKRQVRSQFQGDCRSNEKPIL